MPPPAHVNAKHVLPSFPGTCSARLFLAQKHDMPPFLSVFMSRYDVHTGCPLLACRGHSAWTRRCDAEEATLTSKAGERHCAGKRAAPHRQGALMLRCDT
eukprot:366337-Chlamydomonas_euryale.AAC.16